MTGRIPSNETGQSGPIGRPIGFSSASPLTSVNNDSGLANDGAHTGTTPPKRTSRQLTYRRDVEAIADRISPRDWSIMKSVAEHQFLTTRHITALHFDNHPPTARDRLARRSLARRKH